MKILILGDIFGKPGREMVAKNLLKIRTEHQIDFTIANGENSAHGSGITPSVYELLRAAGVDLITGGNHSFVKKEIFPLMQAEKPLILRPDNFPPSTANREVPGKGFCKITAQNGKQILVINLMGRVFSKLDLDCPFRAFDRIYAEQYDESVFCVIVDFHGEASSEKVAFGHYSANRANIVFGTHTHVPTADLRLVSEKTLFITDIGMVGVYDSVIGLEKQSVINKFLTQIPGKQDIAEGKVDLYGLIVELDDSSGAIQKHQMIHYEN
jgi:metallophosphoesterase (TIGR00282 family)